MYLHDFTDSCDAIALLEALPPLALQVGYRSQLLKLKNVQLNTDPNNSFDDAVLYSVKDVSSSTSGFLVGVNATF